MFAEESTSSVRPESWSQSALWMVAAAAATGVGVWLARLRTLGFGPEALGNLFEELPKALVSGTYDAAFLAGHLACGLVLLWLVGRKAWARRTVLGLFFIGCLLLLAAALANIEVVRMLGRPFTYQWFYYSGYAATAAAMEAIKPSLTWEFFKVVLAAFGAALFLTPVFHRLLTAVGRLITVREALFALIPLLAAYLAFGHWYLTTEQWPMAKLANPVTAFAGSVANALRQAPLLSMPTPYGPDDYLRAGQREQPPARRDWTVPVPIRNVIFFVFESTHSRCLQLYGGEFDVMPNLSRWSNRAAVFDGVYAQTPSTNAGMLSLLCSVYPWPSYKSVFMVSPDAKLGCFASTMQRSGRRTAFLTSSGLEFGDAGTFLARHGFEYLQDWRGRADSQYKFKSEWEYLYGTSESDTVSSLIDWIGRSPDQRGQPFFAVLWTLQAHYPYYLKGDVTPFTKDDMFNRYLSSVREMDAAFGDLMDWLEREGLAEETLVVALSDHGEAFGVHGHFGHGTAIYEENIAVLTAFINPQLFHGETHQVLGCLADIVPTVAEILGLPDDPMWQGRSLFSPERSGRMYLVQPYNDLQFGFREGDLKLIYNAWGGETEVYDLKADPWEMKNLAASRPDFVRTGKERLAAWIRYQNDFFEKSFSDAGNPPVMPPRYDVPMEEPGPPGSGR